MTCWNCHEAVGGPACVGCGALQQPPPTVDPFALIGIERRYHLDLATVEDAYRKKARQLHPDRFAGRAPAEKRFALQWTAHLNESRRILKDPVRRARYLATGAPDPQETGGPKLDPLFLQEMFDWREADEENPGALQSLAVARAALLNAELEQIFVEWEAGKGSLELVDDRLARLKYVNGMIR